MKKFIECLNDLMDYFILADPLVLTEFMEQHKLPGDLLTEFTTTNNGDRAVVEEILIPMAGVENYPYTIYFNAQNESSVFDDNNNDLQIHKIGYSLLVSNREIYLFTMPFLKNWPEHSGSLTEQSHRPRLKLDNGWYDVEILGGETQQESGWEPTFEFKLKKCNSKPTFTGDTHFRFLIKSREY